MVTKSKSAKTSSQKSSAGVKKSASKGGAKKMAATKDDASIYTDPALRERLKAEIMAGDKGGKPDQWSARKSQLLVQEYERAGGDYKKGAKKGATQKSLEKWTDEEWRTSDNKKADRAGGTTRYLPDKAWEALTPAQKQATNRKKQEGSRDGEQFVANTASAKQARAKATKGATKATAKKASATKSAAKKTVGKKTASKKASVK